MGKQYPEKFYSWLPKFSFLRKRYLSKESSQNEKLTNLYLLKTHTSIATNILNEGSIKRIPFPMHLEICLCFGNIYLT